MLLRKSRKLNFIFVQQDSSWYNQDGLNEALHHDDKIHLSNIGNMKLSNTIIRKIKSLCSSSTSDPIRKIPSTNEVDHNDNGSNIDVSSVSNSFVPPVRHYVKPMMVRPSFIPAPECDYDHSKALKQVLLKEPHYSVPISSRSESRKKRRDKKKGFSVGGHPPRLLVSSSSSKSQSQSQSPPPPPLLQQLSSHQSTVIAPCSLLRTSFCGSFVSFLMMVLANFIFPLLSPYIEQGQRIL